MSDLSRESIISIDDSTSERVFVKEWNGTVYIKTMTLEERLEFDHLFTGPDGKFKNANDPKLIYHLLFVCIVDGNNNRIFTSPTDEALKTRNAIVLNRLLELALSVNFLKTDSQEAIKKK